MCLFRPNHDRAISPYRVLRRVSSLAAKPAGILIGGEKVERIRFLPASACSFLSLSLSSLAHFCQLCFCHFFSVLDSRRWCLGGARLNLTDGATTPTPLSLRPSSPPATRQRCGGPVTCLLLRHRCQSGEGPCCVSRKLGGRVGEGKTATWVFCEKRTSWLLCFLIPLSAEQQGESGEDESERILFSHRMKRGPGCISASEALAGADVVTLHHNEIKQWKYFSGGVSLLPIKPKNIFTDV